MKKNKSNRTPNFGPKARYMPPRIQTLLIELENALAASSATVKPTNAVGEVKQEWETGTDRTSTLDW